MSDAEAAADMKVQAGTPSDIPGTEPAVAALSLKQRAVSEMVGTALLLATVVGSGIMGEQLA